MTALQNDDIRISEPRRIDAFDRAVVLEVGPTVTARTFLHPGDTIILRPDAEIRTDEEDASRILSEVGIAGIIRQPNKTQAAT